MAEAATVPEDVLGALPVPEALARGLVGIDVPLYLSQRLDCRVNVISR